MRIDTKLEQMTIDCNKIQIEQIDNLELYNNDKLYGKNGDIQNDQNIYHNDEKRDITMGSMLEVILPTNFIMNVQLFNNIEMNINLNQMQYVIQLCLSL